MVNPRFKIRKDNMSNLMYKGGWYDENQLQEFLERAIRFMKENPKASRAKVTTYAGCGIGVLERFEKEGRLKLPPVMTSKQARKLSPWAKTLGQLSGRRS